MAMGGFSAVILAAGKGTRMRSSTPKVLHPIAGLPMVRYVIDAVRELGPDRLILVVGHEAPLVRQTLGDSVEYREQAEQLGTGHALLQTQGMLQGEAETLLVLYGDTPLLSSGTLSRLLQRHWETKPTISLLTCHTTEPSGLGRIIRDDEGRLRGIREESETGEQERAIQEVNTGIYCFQCHWLWKHLASIPRSRNGEFFLTDLVGMALTMGQSVETLVLEDPREGLGVNNRLHLAQAEEAIRGRIRERLMLQGVSLVHPSSVFIDATVEIGEDTLIYPNTTILGQSRIGGSCTIGPNSIIIDSTIGTGCRILASVIEGSTLEDEVSVGPFSHIRPESYLASGVHIGNFAEVKQSRLGKGTQMGHFSYLGDAILGEEVNVGAGTITCNFDGVRKNETIIGDKAFIGSDTMLVAPVRIGSGSVTGAGSVVTRDVPENTLVYGVPARPQTRRNSSKKGR